MRSWLMLGLLGGLCSACGNSERNGNQGPPPSSGGTGATAGSAGASSGGTAGGSGTSGGGGNAGTGGALPEPDAGTCAPGTSCVEFLWGGGAGRVDATGVAFDPDGNIYTMGRALGSRGSVPLHPVAGYTDPALVKWNSAVGEIWSTHWGSPGYDNWRTVATDAAGNSYSVAAVELAVEGSTLVGSYDVALAKHDPQGAQVWVHSWGSSGSDDALGVAVSATGDVYVAGQAAGDFDGQTTIAGLDAFVSKWTSGGVKQWSRQFGSADGATATGVAVDDAGNVYVSGWTGGALPDQTSSGLRDAFLSKWSSAGEHLWTRQWGSAELDRADAVAVAGGSVYVSGTTLIELNSDGYSTKSGTGDAFVSVFDLEGQMQRTETVAGESEERLTQVVARPDGSAVMVVESMSELPLRPVRDVLGTEIFLIRVPLSGPLEYLYGWGTDGFDIPWAMDIDATGTKVAVVGYAQGGGDVLESQFLLVYALP